MGKTYKDRKGCNEDFEKRSNNRGLKRQFQDDEDFIVKPKKKRK